MPSSHSESRAAYVLLDGCGVVLIDLKVVLQ